MNLTVRALQVLFWVEPRAGITRVVMTQFIRSKFNLSDDMLTVFYGTS